jgi:MFS family permease
LGRRPQIAAAVGPLLGGFITTYLSWRIAFLLEDLVIVIVPSGIRLIHDVPYTGPRGVDVVGAALSVLGMGGILLGMLVWQEGGESVAALLATGTIAMVGLFFWLARRKRRGEATLFDPGLFKSLQIRHLPADVPADSPRRNDDRLPICLQVVREYNAMQAGLSLAPLSLTMFAVALLAGKREQASGAPAASGWDLDCSRPGD